MITKKEINWELKRLTFSEVKGTESEMEFYLWNLDELDELNEMYEVENYHDGFFGIGSNGGEEMLALNLESGFVYAIPFISIDNSENIKVAESLSKLIRIK